jgi:hypothetical protein
MKIELYRKFKGADYTIGDLKIDGKKFCETLEDTVRKIDEKGNGKIDGKTAIPASEYLISLTYSSRFGYYLPLLEGVPHFSGVRIHSGNTAEDTEGCILVGENKEKGKVINSKKWFDNLNALFCKLIVLQKKEPITIKIF